MTTLPAILDEAAFDYGGVASTTATTLREQASRIRKINKSVMTSIIAVGKDLVDARFALPHGRFQDWVEAECGFSMGTAENYMKAARLAEGRIATVAILEPRTAYLLGSKSTPPQVIADVIADAAAGKPVAFRKVREAVDDAKNALREEELGRQKASREQRTPRRTRERRAAEKVRWEAEKRQSEERGEQLAAEIIRRFGEENARYLAKVFDQDPTCVWSVFDNLRSRLGPLERAA